MKIKSILLCTVCMIILTGLSAPGVISEETGTIEEVFSRIYDPADPEIASLAALPEYDYKAAAAQMNYWLNPRSADGQGQERVTDYYDLPYEYLRDRIFKIYTFKNPNYVSWYLENNELEKNMPEEPMYVVPVAFQRSENNWITGTLFYQRDSEGQWYCSGADAYRLKTSESYFDLLSIQRKLEEMDIYNVKDMRVVVFARYYTMLYIKDHLEKEYLLGLDYPSLGAGVLNPEEDRPYLYPFDEIGFGKGISADGIPELGKQYYKTDFTQEAEVLEELGLLRGTGNGYELNELPNRLQAITMLVRAMGQEPAALAMEGENVFEDIPDDNWGVKYANYAYTEGITQGTGEKQFSPDTEMTYRNFLMLMLREMGYDAPDRNEVFSMANKIGLIERYTENFKNISQPGDGRDDVQSVFTRGDMIKIVYNALDCKTADGQLLREKLGL